MVSLAVISGVITQRKTAAAAAAPAIGEAM